MVERPFRKIELHHFDDPSRRVFWPGWRAWVPAITTISPDSRPLETATVAGLWRSTSTLRKDTVSVDGSTTQTAGCWLALVRAVAGISIVGAVSNCTCPMTVAPSRMEAGGSVNPTFTSNVLVTGSACGETSRTRPTVVTAGSSVRPTLTGGSLGADLST